MKLSVIIPVYNGEKTLRECLESVKSSNFQDYELIVIDDGSRDATCSIAVEYTDRVIRHRSNQGVSFARKSGFKAARGDIIVGVDADILIKKDTLRTIVDYFSQHPEIDALTGLLSKKHPPKNFFSQYKNLYMNYIFNRLSGRITFLYGSIHAVRASSISLYNSEIDVGEDLLFGQRLIFAGRQIAFLPNLEVIHLKQYSLCSFIKNDFIIPFYWTRIFFRYKGFRQLGKAKTGFAHSPKQQLISVIMAPAIAMMGLAVMLGYNRPLLPGALILAVWIFCNLRFMAFLKREKDPLFVIMASAVTLGDHLVMAGGIICGSFYALFSRIQHKE